MDRSNRIELAAVLAIASEKAARKSYETNNVHDLIARLASAVLGVETIDLSRPREVIPGRTAKGRISKINPPTYVYRCSKGHTIECVARTEILSNGRSVGNWEPNQGRMVCPSCFDGKAS